jgi:ATP-dependent Clp endopeptidase proteolytic subunit ClpP
MARREGCGRTLPRGGEPLSDHVSDLRALKALKMELEIEKLRHEVTIESNEAKKSAIYLASAEDSEADRLAKVGSRQYRQLDVTAPIYSMNVDAWIDRLEHWERRDPGEPIVVRINSPGGSILDGFALYDTLMRLRRKGHKITTHGIGIIASMATVIMQAGEERVLDRNAWFLVHEASAGAMGKTSDMEDMLKIIEKLERRTFSILAERSNLSATQIKTRWKRKEELLSAEETVKLGLVDRVE